MPNSPRFLRRAYSRKNMWERAPSSVKKSVGRLLGWIPAEYLLGAQFRRKLRFVEEVQYWPAERARELQLKRLKESVTQAERNSPFYRRRFHEIGFQPGDLKRFEDFEKLPFIDKHTLREYLDEMTVIELPARGVDYVATGGTSGVPLQFYIGAERSAIEHAYLVSGWMRVGYRLGAPLAVFRGRVVPEDPALGIRHEYDAVLRHHFYGNYHMTDDNMRRYLEHVATIGPCFLHVYPSSVFALARWLERSGTKPPPNIRGILSGSENVYEEERARVERAFGIRYNSWYGHSEKLVLAAECEHSHDYHVWPTYGYCELIDGDGKPVTKLGARGEIVGSGFINRVVPFVRYRTGDFATLVGHRCDLCGREQMLLRDIRGHRIQEMLVASDGAEMSWVALNMHDDTFERVQQFQFYQDKPGFALLRLVPTREFTDVQTQRILNKLERKFDGRLSVSIELVDSIPLSPRGKAIYVDQRLDLGRPLRSGGERS